MAGWWATLASMFNGLINTPGCGVSNVFMRAVISTVIAEFKGRSEIAKNTFCFRDFQVECVLLLYSKIFLLLYLQ